VSEAQESRVSEDQPFARVNVEHVLKTPALKRGHRPHGWAHRLCDEYRARALTDAFRALHGSLLDYGCGDKPYEALLSSARITSWLGVDVEKRTSGERFANKADRFLDGTRIPYPDASFDIVLATQVLEHVVDLEGTLREMARVTRPGGTLVATCPQTSPLHEEPYDFRRFTPYGMSLHAARAGFDLVRTVALGGPLATLGSLAALHLHSLSRVPFVGASLHPIAVDLILDAAQGAEKTAFRFGMKQTSLTCDYMFVCTRRGRDSSS
jgi:SAM-dependent methyltransferase